MSTDFVPGDIPIVAYAFRRQWEDVQNSDVILYPEETIKPTSSTF